MGNWERNVRQVVPYTPGEQPQEKNIIKLNTNENPYPPAPAVQAALRNLSSDALRKYPDPAAGKLVDALAKRYQVDPAQVFVGVGSDDVLAMAFQTFFNSGKPVLFPDITYSFYDVWADAFRISYKKIPLTDSSARMTIGFRTAELFFQIQMRRQELHFLPAKSKRFWMQTEMLS